MRIAPDINNPPIPKPTTNGNGGGNAGKGGNANRLVFPAFDPGQLNALAEQLNAGFGGGEKNWKANLRQTTGPTVLDLSGVGGGRGKGKGGKNDPGKNGNGTGTGPAVDPRPDVANPHGRMAPMAMPYGVLAGLQPGMGVMSGIPMQQPQQMAAPQMQMPDSGVLAMLRARMGR